MPLINSKSKKAFSHNVKAEMDAGKPQDQSVAIAYATKRNAMKKKMYDGGRVTTTKITKPRMVPSSVIKESQDHDVMYEEPKESEEEHKATMEQKFQDAKEKPAYEEGGFVQTLEEKAKAAGDAIKKAVGAPGVTQEDPNKQRFLKTASNSKAEGGEIMKRKSMIDAIMDKKRYANGGQVDIGSNNEEQPNSYYEQNEDYALKENYDETMESMSQPTDSNEHRPDITKDEYDMIDAIRRKIKSKMTS